MDIVLILTEIFFSIAALGNYAMRSSLGEGELQFGNATNATGSNQFTETMVTDAMIEDAYPTGSMVLGALEWTGIIFFLLTLLVVLYETLVWLKVVYRQRKMNSIYKQSLKAKEAGDETAENKSARRVGKSKKRRLSRLVSISPRNLKRIKHERSAESSTRILAISNVREKQRRNTADKLQELKELRVKAQKNARILAERNAARARLGQNRLNEKKMAERQLKKQKVKIHRKHVSFKKRASNDLVVESLVDDFKQDMKRYEMEKELIRHKQQERTQERLKVRRSKRKLAQSLGRERSLKTLIRKGSFKSIAKKINSKRTQVVKAVVRKFDKNGGKTTNPSPSNTKVAPVFRAKMMKAARPPPPKPQGNGSKNGSPGVPPGRDMIPASPKKKSPVLPKRKNKK